MTETIDLGGKALTLVRTLITWFERVFNGESSSSSSSGTARGSSRTLFNLEVGDDDFPSQSGAYSMINSAGFHYPPRNEGRADPRIGGIKVQSEPKPAVSVSQSVKQ